MLSSFQLFRLIRDKLAKNRLFSPFTFFQAHLDRQTDDILQKRRTINEVFRDAGGKNGISGTTRNKVDELKPCKAVVNNLADTEAAQKYRNILCWFNEDTWLMF